ncbi:hypothetical protein GCM10009742_45360 [Kribbella karoonensis]|uniref:Uncharacterized protein n=1 Tax=Kribbella karoonensis TaxID=324851 RepID=A0ABN2E4Y9_9ACTN
MLGPARLLLPLPMLRTLALTTPPAALRPLSRPRRLLGGRQGLHHPGCPGPL